MRRGKYLYDLAGLLMGGLVVLDILEFFESLRFRTILAQVLTELATGVVDTFVTTLVEQFFGVAPGG